MKDNSGQSPLHLSASCGHLSVVKSLLEVGSDIEAQDNKKETPIHLAAKNGHSEVVKYLLEKNASSSCPNSKNLFPIHQVKITTSNYFPFLKKL